MKTLARFVSVLVLSVGVLPAGCSSDHPNTCVGEELVHVKMSGSCAAGRPEFDVVRVGCLVTLNLGNLDIALPTVGAIDEEGHVLRGGGWQLFGCTEGQEPCLENFRRCTTLRVDWQLDMTCLDGSGALACQATLTE